MFIHSFCTKKMNNDFCLTRNENVLTKQRMYGKYNTKSLNNNCLWMKNDTVFYMCLNLTFFYENCLRQSNNLCQFHVSIYDFIKNILP